MPTANVYIDGFNLYYGAVKGTPYRWLDVRKMCELLLPDLQVERIKYFTARVSGRSCRRPFSQRRLRRSAPS